MFRFCLAVYAITVSCAPIEAAERVDFQRDVQPIFEQHCIECHGATEQSSGLRLDRRGSLLRGGDVGQPSLVPGKPDESFLLAAISGVNSHDLRMPPEGEPLAAEEVQTLRRWIVEGADWPGQMQATAETIESELWSLRPLDGEASRDTSGSATIDRWIEQRLQQEGLSLSEPADEVSLLRRVSLVLTGLPPTPEELAETLSGAQSPEQAYRRAVERLLASPRYGERWAQHWLDVIRWAETVGFETNGERPNAWPYRDWVIASLNEDKPYDQFLFEQIAGDTVGQDAALGFLVAGPANLPGQVGRDEEAMRQARQDELDEVIGTVSQAAFGLTIGCARCHNHKFDPILQRDYYALQAIFSGLHYGERRLRGAVNDLWTAALPDARKRLEELVERGETLRGELRLKPELGTLQTDSFAPVLARAVRMEIAATGSGGPASLYEFEAWTLGGEEASRNVALASNGATASASSFALENQSRHFENLIDGAVDRRQDFPWVSAERGPAWLQIDFAQPQLIDRIVWDQGSSQPAEYVVKVLVAPDEQASSPEAGSATVAEADWRIVADSSQRWLREDDTRAADAVHLSGLSREQIAAVVDINSSLRAARSEIARLSAGPQVFAATFSDPPEVTWLLNRGDPMSRRDVVAPAIPRVLGELGLDNETSDPQRRIALARHLISPHHPLTARVIVNRVWQHHFGEGLVDTPSDFGEMGSLPTHPELLDQLAAQFVRDGWSLKKLHRQIVLSQTFRQASRPRPEALAIDAGSRLLWRYPPRRLEAEAIRDSVLQASGKLNFQMGGAGFNFFKQRGGLSDYQALETFDEQGWRRMIYAHKIRMQSIDIFGAFDCPDSGQMKPKRTRSITPTQSLSLFNSPFINRQAGFFADRVASEVGDDVCAQIKRAFIIAYSRPPSDAEQQRMQELARVHGLSQLCRVLMNSSEFITIP